MSLKKFKTGKLFSATHQLDDQLRGMGFKIQDRAPNGDIPIDVRGFPGGPRRVMSTGQPNPPEAIIYETRH